MPECWEKEEKGKSSSSSSSNSNAMHSTEIHSIEIHIVAIPWPLIADIMIGSLYELTCAHTPLPAIAEIMSCMHLAWM
eukprot:6060494-Lingulodinium_polyedra.AAC.1